MKAGDVVTKIDGQEITPENTLSFIVARIKPGTTVPIEIIRNGKKMTLNATIGQRPPEEELNGPILARILKKAFRKMKKK